MEHELRAAQGAAAGGSSDAPVMIEKPDKCANLRKAMSLMNDSETYHQFMVSILIFFLGIILKPNCAYYRRISETLQ